MDLAGDPAHRPQLSAIILAAPCIVPASRPASQPACQPASQPACLDTAFAVRTLAQFPPDATGSLWPNRYTVAINTLSSQRGPSRTTHISIEDAESLLMALVSPAGWSPRLAVRHTKLETRCELFIARCQLLAVYAVYCILGGGMRWAAAVLIIYALRFCVHPLKEVAGWLAV